MISNPLIWKHIPLIKVNHPDLKNILGKENDRFSYLDFYDDKQQIIIQNLYDQAEPIHESKRSKLQKDVIQVYHRLLITEQILFNTSFQMQESLGMEMFNVFPIPDEKNNKWISDSKKLPLNFYEDMEMKKIYSKHHSAITKPWVYYLYSVKKSTISGDWSLPDKKLSWIMNLKRTWHFQGIFYT